MRADSLHTPLFVYGTLMFPELQEALVGRCFASEDAAIIGYEARVGKFKGQITDYPFLYAQKGAQLKGKLLIDISAADLRLLQYYEGDEYSLKVLPILSKSFQEALVFCPHSFHKMEYDIPWDIEYFSKHHLQTYSKEIIPQVVIEFLNSTRE